MYSKDQFPALGSVFRMTEGELITKLENLVNYIPDIYEIRESAGIHQLYLLIDDIEPKHYLEKHYMDVEGEIAA
jgi:hypothetical protein